MLTRKDIKRLKDKLYRLISKEDLGRDHYRDSQGEFLISRNIHPVHDVGFLMPHEISPIQTATVAAGFATIDIQPLTRGQTWLIDFISVTHTDVAAKPLAVQYRDIQTTTIMNLTSSAGHNISPTVNTPVFPKLYDLSGAADHEHTVSNFSIPLTNPNNTIRLNFGPATNGKVLTAQFIYRRVL